MRTLRVFERLGRDSLNIIRRQRFFRIKFLQEPEGQRLCPARRFPRVLLFLTSLNNWANAPRFLTCDAPVMPQLCPNWTNLKNKMSPDWLRVFELPRSVHWSSCYQWAVHKSGNTFSHFIDVTLKCSLCSLSSLPVHCQSHVTLIAEVQSCPWLMLYSVCRLMRNQVLVPEDAFSVPTDRLSHSECLTAQAWPALSRPGQSLIKTWLWFA